MFSQVFVLHGRTVPPGPVPSPVHYPVWGVPSGRIIGSVKVASQDRVPRPHCTGPGRMCDADGMPLAFTHQDISCFWEILVFPFCQLVKSSNQFRQKIHQWCVCNSLLHIIDWTESFAHKSLNYLFLNWTVSRLFNLLRLFSISVRIFCLWVTYK